MHVRNALRALLCILAQTLSTPSVHIQTDVRPLLSTLHLERAAGALSSSLSSSLPLKQSIQFKGDNVEELMQEGRLEAVGSHEYHVVKMAGIKTYR